MLCVIFCHNCVVDCYIANGTKEELEELNMDIVYWLLQELQQSAYVCGQLNIESNCFWKRRQKPCFCAVNLQAPVTRYWHLICDFQVLSAGFCHFNITLEDYSRPSNLQQYCAWYVWKKRTNKQISQLSVWFHMSGQPLIPANFYLLNSDWVHNGYLVSVCCQRSHTSDGNVFTMDIYP